MTVPGSRNTGLSLASASSVVPGRGCSSRSTVTVRRLASKVSTGTTSSAKRPASHASPARRWDWSANASCSSRLTAYRSARFSAVSPMASEASGSMKPSEDMPSSITAGPIRYPPRIPRSRYGRAGHVLHADDQGHVDLTEDDRPSRQCQRLGARPTRLVDGVGGHRLRYPGPDRHLPPRVRPIPGLTPMPGHRLVDLARVDPGGIKRRPSGSDPKVDRWHVRKRPHEPPHRGPLRAHNHHRTLLHDPSQAQPRLSPIVGRPAGALGRGAMRGRGGLGRRAVPPVDGPRSAVPELGAALALLGGWLGGAGLGAVVADRLEALGGVRVRPSFAVGRPCRAVGGGRGRLGRGGRVAGRGRLGGLGGGGGQGGLSGLAVPADDPSAPRRPRRTGPAAPAGRRSRAEPGPRSRPGGRQHAVAIISELPTVAKVAGVAELATVAGSLRSPRSSRSWARHGHGGRHRRSARQGRHRRRA